MARTLFFLFVASLAGSPAFALSEPAFKNQTWINEETDAHIRFTDREIFVERDGLIIHGTYQKILPSRIRVNWDESMLLHDEIFQLSPSLRMTVYIIQKDRDFINLRADSYSQCPDQRLVDLPRLKTGRF